MFALCSLVRFASIARVVVALATKFPQILSCNLLSTVTQPSFHQSFNMGSSQSTHSANKPKASSSEKNPEASRSVSGLKSTKTTVDEPIAVHDDTETSSEYESLVEESDTESDTDSEDEDDEEEGKWSLSL